MIKFYNRTLSNNSGFMILGLAWAWAKNKRALEDFSQYLCSPGVD
jgi:hypothetical protein